jgi:hypothetical protein
MLYCKFGEDRSSSRPLAAETEFVIFEAFVFTAFAEESNDCH